MQFPVAEQTEVNDPLLASRAEWISPGYDDEIFADGGTRWRRAPRRRAGTPTLRVADGAKVVISDTDHYAPGQGDALWAWKSFLRGHHPILMDFGLIAGLEPDGRAARPRPACRRSRRTSRARWAMGDTRRYAERIGLVDMQPRDDVASTGYALVNPGVEYLVLQPDGDASVHRRPAAGRVPRWNGSTSTAAKTTAADD